MQGKRAVADSIEAALRRICRGEIARKKRDQ
jgi:hypothetical protein